MKKAFTLLELVLVVVIVGIISAVMVPRLNDTHIDKAAQQVLQHIRYTQHLAMMDNKFDPNDPNWFKKRWQIKFQKNVHEHEQKLYYSIYSDSNADGKIDLNETAVNPLNHAQHLTGDESNDSKVMTQTMNLSDDYKIDDISMLGCAQEAGAYGYNVIAFDYLGRPIMKDINGLTSSYSSNDNRLVQNTCRLLFTNKTGEVVTISIEPETGYAYISQIQRLNQNRY